MNNEEAKGLLQLELAKYRQRSYIELQRLLTTQDTYEITGPTGVTYQVEIQAFWDNRKSGNLRVLGAIDDGGLRAFVPLSDDFILSPEGKFIGE